MPNPKKAGRRNSPKCRSRNAWTMNCSRRVSKRPTMSRIGLSRRTTMKKNERSSVTLRWLKNQLREEAIKEKDEERKKKLWRWYFRAEDAEREVDILVLKAEIRALLEIAA